MKKNVFKHSPIPYLFIAPQLLIILIFFVWPAWESIRISFFMEDPFGLGSTFVGLQNYIDILHNNFYLQSIKFTLIFSVLVTFFSLAIALLLAVKADKVIKGKNTYKILIIWPYAVAPAVAGMVGVFLLDYHVGPLYHLLNFFWDFDHKIDAVDASFAVVLVSVWKQISVNFVYFLAGLQGIPKAVQEAAKIDCRSNTKRFWSIIFPLLAPTTFFLLIINITYAFFDTFGIIDTLTRGRPGGATTTLVYKVYQDGFVGVDLGGSSAQSVILMLFVIALTVIQFKYIEKKIHY
ncbi:ABC transporter permease subunit [Gallibacterium salpingitidis]|uniref:sn-glycerol-3-phosphate transport system permease protein UgpA n=1 Tax=Gallibacterium salpingitidis TaxID=505341 RepID=A0A1A7NYH7_9PAST|nr:ABC transporter permease subunit [Gallibacterium salpingitidis]OBW94640.1 glycerol-3-phosphate transporter permease [Gallibacterium salpingitidis]